MNIKQLQQKLEQYDNEIKNNELKKASIEGKQENNLKQLEQFNVDVNDIDNLIEDISKKLETLEQEILEYLEQLEQFEIMQEE